MKLPGLLFPTTLAATAAAISIATQTAAAEECQGPFVQCARGVSAQCSQDPDGVQRMTFRDTGGRVVLFEKCVGGIYEARGLPNPYKTGNLGSDDLPFPRAEVIDPRTSND
jgi:hypothetical protein